MIHVDVITYPWHKRKYSSYFHVNQMGPEVLGKLMSTNIKIDWPLLTDIPLWANIIRFRMMHSVSKTSMIPLCGCAAKRILASYMVLLLIRHSRIFVLTPICHTRFFACYISIFNYRPRAELFELFESIKTFTDRYRYFRNVSVYRSTSISILSGRLS